MGMKLRVSCSNSVGDRGICYCARDVQCPRCFGLRRMHWSVFLSESVSTDCLYRAGSPHQTDAEIVSGRSISSIGLLGSPLRGPLAFILLLCATCLNSVTANSPLPSLHAWEDLDRGVSRPMLRLAIVSHVIDVAGAVFMSFVGLAVRVVA